MSASSRVESELDTDVFKFTQIEHHINFREFAIAQETIKKYIQTRGCILYGGIAIDYALRLKGDKIYEDGSIPDFDFWSPSHIQTAREIIDILTALLPGTNIYGIRAKYVRTMRVSVGSNNWVADITYIPPALFERIPTLTYDGMRIVHPHFQFSDLHSSLSFPYDNAPMEVVFARWKKDIQRFNKLFTAYTPEFPRDLKFPKMQQTTIPLALATHTVLNGFAAYSIYYNIALEAGIKLDAATIPAARAPELSKDDSVVVLDVPFETVELFSHRVSVPYLANPSHVIKYAPLLDLIEPTIVSDNIILFNSVGRFVGYQSYSLDTHTRTSANKQIKIRACSIQALLKFFIASYIRAQFLTAREHEREREIVSAQTYLIFYLSCIKLINLSRDTPAAHYFDPSIDVFGDTSIPWYDTVALQLDVQRILDAGTSKNAPRILLPPKNMRASSTSHDASGETAFDYSKCPFTLISGEKI